MLGAHGVSKVEVDALGEAIACAAADVDRATHALLTNIRAFDELRGWFQHGALSCAHWLSWRCGIALGPAREKVRVAHRLAELPRVDAAMRDGELSYSKARAITRVATPETEAELLDMARAAPAAQLEKICRLYRRVQSQAAEAARADERKRWVRTRHMDDGMVRVEAQLEADEAKLVMTAIRGAANNRADGLVALAEAAARGDKPQRPPVELTVTIDAATLTGQLDDGSGIPAETCRRLCCDAGLVPVITDEHGATLDVGRKTRTISSALRRALCLRDGGCAFPGCTNTVCDAHHIEHWIDGGATSLDNTLLLCRRHHRFRPRVRLLRRAHRGRRVRVSRSQRPRRPDGRRRAAAHLPAPDEARPAGAGAAMGRHAHRLQRRRRCARRSRGARRAAHRAPLTRRCRAGPTWTSARRAVG